MPDGLTLRGSWWRVMFYALCSIPSGPSRFGAFIHPATTKGLSMSSVLPVTHPTTRPPVCTNMRMTTSRYDIGLCTRYLRAVGINAEKLDVAHKLTCCAVEFCTAPEDTTYSIWFYASSDPLSCHIPLLVCERQPHGNWVTTQWNPRTYTPA